MVKEAMMEAAADAVDAVVVVAAAAAGLVLRHAGCSSLTTIRVAANKVNCWSRRTFS